MKKFMSQMHMTKLYTCSQGAYLKRLVQKAGGLKIRTVSCGIRIKLESDSADIRKDSEGSDKHRVFGPLIIPCAKKWVSLDTIHQ